MFRIRLVNKKHLYIGLKGISYAIVSDNKINEWLSRNYTESQVMQYDAYWFTTIHHARVFPSIENMLRSLTSICKKDQTYSRYEVVFLDEKTEQLDSFLTKIRKK